MNRKQMSETVDCWIDEQDLPPRPGLKPIRQFSCLEFDNEDEQQAYWDFVHWFMTQDYALLLSLPKQPQHSDFWAFEGDDSISFHYGSIDYQRAHPFDKHAYRLRKIYERVDDLALLHSCICHEEGKANIAKRFKKLVDDEFRNKVCMLLENYRKYPHLMNKEKLFARISELNGRILKCKCIWRKCAYSEQKKEPFQALFRMAISRFPLRSVTTASSALRPRPTQLRSLPGISEAKGLDKNV